MDRTDLHSPSNFRPEDYTYIGAVYVGPMAFIGWTTEAILQFRDPNKILPLANFSGGNWEEKRKCDHCGAVFHYGCGFKHKDGQVIIVGHECADKRFGCESRRDFDYKKMMAKVEAVRETIKRNLGIRALLDANAGLEEALKCDNHIVRDIDGRLQQWGTISDKQIALVFKIAREDAQRKADKAAQLANAKPVPSGRQVITGTLISTKDVDSQFGTVTKMLIQCDGYRLWGTMPASLPGDVERGATIRFTATAEPHPTDAGFGFFSRPTKATVVVAQPAASDSV